LNFELRDAVASDFDSCIALLPSSFLCEPERYGTLRTMWTEIVTSKSGLAAVATDPVRKSSVIHFGFAVFVSDQRANGYHRCVAPLIARRIMAEWAAGDHPFLAADEIARANAGQGLNVVILHSGDAPAGDGLDKRVYAADYEASRRILLGWNLRSYTAEIFTGNQRRDGNKWGKALGFRVGGYSTEKLRGAGIPQDQAPCVWMARREDAVANPGLAPLLFTSFMPPHLGFAPHEQELLLLALEGHTDNSIAQAARISPSTVKKRLRRIYEKVQDARCVGELPPGLFTNGVRGAETRRHLLNYCREHPEELRPYDSCHSQPPAMAQTGGLHFYHQ